MRCKKHNTDPSSTVGVCASCLRDRLSALILAQSQSHAHHALHSEPRKSEPPPLLFPRSVSPYVTRRKSDDATDPLTWSHTHVRFYSTPQVGPTSTTHFTAAGSFPKKNKKFSLFSSLFRSKSHKLNPDVAEPSPTSSPSWIPNFLSSRRKKHPAVYSVEFPGRRNRKPSDRGMSPVRAEAECEDCDRSASGSGCSSESPERWRKTPPFAAARRGKHGRNVSGLAFCLSPLVRASPNRNWSHKTVAGIPPDIGISGEVNVKPHLSTAASFCANRSRKLADFGRVNRNR